MTKFAGKGDWFVEFIHDKAFVYAGPFRTRNEAHVWRLNRMGTKHIPLGNYEVMRIPDLVETANELYAKVKQSLVEQGADPEALDSVGMLYCKTSKAPGAPGPQVPAPKFPEVTAAPKPAGRAAEGHGRPERPKENLLAQVFVTIATVAIIFAVMSALVYGLGQ